MLKYVAALIASIAAMLVMAPTQTNAAYNSSNLISNSVFRQSNTMDANQIQNFLASKGSGLANKKWGSQRASDIINKAARDYGINPRVILATLQKEQSLITDPSPDSIQLRSAMGYGCPDNGTCSNEYSGFSYQIENGTWQLRFNYERANGNNSWWNSATNYACKQKDTQHNPPFYNAGLFPGNTVTFSSTGGKPNKTIKIANAATASLYCYTPHVGPYSQTGYSGSYNFVVSFESWFGSTQGNPWIPLQTPRILITNKATSKINPSTEGAVQSLSAGQMIRFRTKQGDCLRTEVDTNNNVNACVKINNLNELTSIVENINNDGTTSKKASQQWTCKIDYTTLQATNQCFKSSTNIVFQKVITVFGNDYLITKHDADRGLVTGFRADRFSD